MSEYKKYKSVENGYRKKYIEDMFKWYPEYMTCFYIITEKIDGANFKISFTKNGNDIDIKFGKRTSWLDDGEKFYNYQAVIEQPEVKQFIEKIKYLMQFVDKEGDKLEFFGELFGEGIQSRIKYCGGKTIRFFDAMFNDEYLTQVEFCQMMDDIQESNMMVPIVGVVDSFDKAMEFDVEGKPTAFNPDDIMEGVVIKPYDVICKNTQGEQQMFYIKNKSEKFNEKMGTKKVKVEKPVEPELQEAMDTYTSYLTENRLLGVFSKEGEIQDPKDIGKYIKLMTTDAREDYLKDNMDTQFIKLEDKQKKQVFKCSGKIVSELLKKYL